ncbi:programmed cell death protein 1 [Phaethornis superciliosus]
MAAAAPALVAPGNPQPLPPPLRHGAPPYVTAPHPTSRRPTLRHGAPPYVTAPHPTSRRPTHLWRGVSPVAVGAAEVSGPVGEREKKPVLRGRKPGESRGRVRLSGQGTHWLAVAPGALKTMWGRVEVTLSCLCALLLCCGPMLSGCRLVTFFPATLTLPAGGSATFFCNISMESDSSSEYSLNWYKEINHTHAQKIAEISWKTPPTVTEKYLLTNHTPAFKIKILNLHQNDSGSYYCGLINFFELEKVMESSRSHLVVTAAPEKTNATDEPDMEEGKPLDHIKTILLSILLLAGAVVLVVFGYLTVMYRRGGTNPLGGCAAPKNEDKPPVVSVSTVDYSMLEFQCDPSPYIPLEIRLADKTEYATIIFPEEKPVTLERGKKHQEERTRQVQSQPC